MIRFHFASDEQFGYEEWYIDDIQLITDITVDVGQDETPSNRFIYTANQRLVLIR